MAPCRPARIRFPPIRLSSEGKPTGDPASPSVVSGFSRGGSRRGSWEELRAWRSRPTIARRRFAQNNAMRRSPARSRFPRRERARHRGSVSLVCYRWFPGRAPSTSRSFSRRRSGLGSLSLCVPIAWSRYFLRSPHAPLSRSSGSPGRWRRGLYRDGKRTVYPHT